MTQPRLVFGELARATGRQLPVTVCRSRAGFYLGTCDDEGPCSRESAEYWPTRSAAVRARHTHMTQQRIVFGELARATGRQLPQKQPLAVCRSQAGFYLGTCDDEGPCSRESAEYWPTRSAAVRALQTGRWTQRQEP